MTKKKANKLEAPLPEEQMNDILEEMVYHKQMFLEYVQKQETLEVTLSKTYKNDVLAAKQTFYTGTPAKKILDWVSAVLRKHNQREV